MDLSGKNGLCFVGLPHHFHKMFALMEFLSSKGMRIEYLTSLRHPSLDKTIPPGYELTFIERNIPYLHAYEFLNESVNQKIAHRLQSITQRIFSHEKEWLKRTISLISERDYFLGIKSIIENYCLFEEILEKKKVDMIFILHELNIWTKILAYLGHKVDVPVFSFQEGLWYEDCLWFTPRYSMMADYSHIFVWGNYTAKILKRLGIPGERIHIVGNSEIDDLLNIPVESWENTKEKVQEENSISKDQKIILFAMSETADLGYLDFPKMFNCLFDYFLDNQDLFLIIKCHPLDSERGLKSKIGRHDIPPNCLFLKDYSSRELMGSCHVLLTFDSTMGLDALVLDKPLCEVNFDNVKYRHSYADYGVAEKLSCFENLYKIKELAYYGIPQKRRANIKNYLQNMFFSLDGKTNERILEVIMTQKRHQKLQS